MRLFTLTLMAFLLWLPARSQATMNEQLRAALDNLSPQEELSVIVTMTDQAVLGPFRDAARNLSRMSREERRQHRQALVRALKQKAENAQGPLRQLLKDKGVRATAPLWIVNGLEVTAGRDVIEALAARADVARVTLNGTLTLPEYTVRPLAATEWNLTAVHAPELWARGITGQGVVIATLDSGVDPAHADIGPKWRGGTNSWFDPYGEHPTLPYDRNGHGTAVTGILVGGSATGTAMGMAPGAQWIAAKIYNDAGVASNLAIHQAFQWLLDPDNNPATDDSPDVVNNSWGFDELPGVCYPEFQPDIQALRAAGIAMSFAAGNTGSLAGTSVSPANYVEAFAVGAVDQSLAVPLFSARGPSACDGSFYPEVVAPGVQIRTAALTQGGVFPTAAVVVDGTSFSAPHVAGAMALLLSALPSQPLTTLEAALQQTASDLDPPGADNRSGSGLINLVPAYDFLLAFAPNIAILPSAHFFNFGTVPINTLLSQTFTVTNVGAVDLQLGSLTVAGANAAEFALSGDSCSSVALSPSAGCSIQIAFQPDSAGRKVAALQIPSNDPDTPMASITLVGNDTVRIGTFRGGSWSLDADGSRDWTPGSDQTTVFGLAGDLPVSGDWNGTGLSRIGVFRSGVWYLDRDGSGSWDAAFDLPAPNFGMTGDRPVVGDWNGDGKSDIGVFRNGAWFLDANGNGTWETGIDLTFVFGMAGDVPVIGDWNGDEVPDIGVFRNGTWYLDMNGNHLWETGSDAAVAFGLPGDDPVPGDWNGDGLTDVGIYRGGTWALDADGSRTWDAAADEVRLFGLPTDLPVTGQWN